MIGESDRDEREELEIEDDYPPQKDPFQREVNSWSQKPAEQKSEDYYYSQQ